MKPKTAGIINNLGAVIGLLGFLVGAVVAIAAAPVAGSILTAVFIIIFGLAFGIPYLRDRKRNVLLKTGRRANGTIVEMWDTGITINKQPQIGLKIEVKPDTGAPFISECIMIISRLQTSYYQVGINCIVRYDPENTKSIAIESLLEN